MSSEGIRCAAVIRRRCSVPRLFFPAFLWSFAWEIIISGVDLLLAVTPFWSTLPLWVLEICCACALLSVETCASVPLSRWSSLRGISSVNTSSSFSSEKQTRSKSWLSTLVSLPVDAASSSEKNNDNRSLVAYRTVLCFLKFRIKYKKHFVNFSKWPKVLIVDVHNTRLCRFSFKTSSPLYHTIMCSQHGWHNLTKSSTYS